MSDTKKRYIQQISSIKQRNGFNYLSDSAGRLVKIQELLSLKDGDIENKELFKYVPIASVACFEGLYRKAIKELIDFGSPYSDNCINSNRLKDIKFDFEIINEINKQTITIGELIAHILPCNKLEDINSNLGAILGKDLLSELSTYSRESILDEKNEEFAYYKKNSGEIIKNIKEIFELRHIFCHEIADGYDLSLEEANSYITSAIRFVNHMEDYINNALKRAGDKDVHTKIDDVDNEIDSLNKLLINHISIIRTIKNVNWPEQFQETFEEFLVAWNVYIEKKADWHETMPYTGLHQLYARKESLIKSTKEMIEDLQHFSSWK